MTRVALVHDWLVAHRGGEKVLLELARLFPEAPIYTLVFDRRRVHRELAGRTIITSFIQRLPGAPKRFRPYLPLFPAAIESFDFRAFDLVLSTSHCVAKGIRADAPHLSYVHTPMRYIWDQLDTYLPRVRGRRLLKAGAEAVAAPLRRWDVSSSARPTSLVANSRFVAERIERFWGRRASVVHPPVDVERFGGRVDQARSGYLVVNALVPYKRTELAVEFASRNRIHLTVVGDGSERRALEHIAGPTVCFRPSVSDAELVELYRSAKALLHGGIEDFGIAPVEAMAAGCPVVAYGRGGVTETVVDGRTGVFFHEPQAAALEAAVRRLDTLDLAAVDIRQHAGRFSGHAFRKNLLNKIKDLPRGEAMLRNAQRRV
ncbi:MAG: glycosyltransferase [Myxococcota bacterium]